MSSSIVTIRALVILGTATSSFPLCTALIEFYGNLYHLNAEEEPECLQGAHIDVDQSVLTSVTGTKQLPHDLLKSMGNCCNCRNCIDGGVISSSTDSNRPETRMIVCLDT